MAIKKDLIKPRVSIGMPVFNGERFVKDAVNSILDQTFKDFELIISDNASTDATQTICQEFASKDERVHYFRNEKNIGGPKNYNRVFELATGEYFKWAAYDDMIAPLFLERCVLELNNDPSLIGCFCKTGRIDQYGNFLGYHNEHFQMRTSAQKPHERFRNLLGMYYITTPFHGLYRANVFAKSQRHGTYIGADRNLVAELSLMGRISEIPECLFFWREHSDSYTSIFYGKERKNTVERLRKETAWWSKEGGTYFPHWKNCLEYFRSVNRVNIGQYERLLCYLQIFDWILRQGRRFLTKDIFLFLLQHSNLAGSLAQQMQSLLTSPVKSKLVYFIDSE